MSLRRGNLDAWEVTGSSSLVDDWTIHDQIPIREALVVVDHVRVAGEIPETASVGVALRKPDSITCSAVSCNGEMYQADIDSNPRGCAITGKSLCVCRTPTRVEIVGVREWALGNRTARQERIRD